MTLNGVEVPQEKDVIEMLCCLIIEAVDLVCISFQVTLLPLSLA